MRGTWETRAARPRARLLLLMTAGALAAGCVSPAFRQSVGQFGAATKTAMTAQAERLARVSAMERDRIRDDLAERRVDLVFDPNTPCNRILSGQDAGPCRLREAAGGAQVSLVPRYEHIAALGNALSGYCESLIALAADSTADQAAFTNAVTAVGTSLSSLNDAIRKVSSAPEQNLSAPIGAIARLVGELGNLYFQHRRNIVLRRVIVEGSDAVRRAITLLREAASRAAQRERAELGETALRSFMDSGRISRNATSTTAQIRQAHARLFDSLDAVNSYNTQIRLFADMGAAHDRLLQAARSGASAADRRAALEAAIHLATTARDTVATINQAGSTGNGN